MDCPLETVVGCFEEAENYPNVDDHNFFGAVDTKHESVECRVEPVLPEVVQRSIDAIVEEVRQHEVNDDEVTLNGLLMKPCEMHMEEQFADEVLDVRKARTRKMGHHGIQKQKRH